MVSMHQVWGRRGFGYRQTIYRWGVMLAIGLLAMMVRGFVAGCRRLAPKRPRGAKNVQSNAQLSREQLAQLLVVPERDPKENVRKIVAEPYCSLQLQVRSGVVSEREAYPRWLGIRCSTSNSVRK
jgi:hypothetical protein